MAGSQGRPRIARGAVWMAGPTSSAGSSRFAASAGRTGLWCAGRSAFNPAARSAASDGQILCSHWLIAPGKSIEPGRRSAISIAELTAPRATRALSAETSSAAVGAAAAQCFLFGPFHGTDGICTLNRSRCCFLFGLHLLGLLPVELVEALSLHRGIKQFQSFAASAAAPAAFTVDRG
jgi:hypothetical protein